MTEVFDPADYNASGYWAEPIGNGQATPAALNGFRSFVSTPGGYWVCRYSKVPLNTPARVRAWRGLRARARQGGVKIEVLLAERLYAPWPRSNGNPVYTPGGIAVTLASAAALNATEIVLTKTAGGALEQGHRFSMTTTRWGKRCYEIASAQNVGGNTWNVTIETGLRDDMASGAACDFETPGFLANIVNANDMVDGDLEYLKRTAGRVVFMEAGPLS